MLDNVCVHLKSLSESLLDFLINAQTNQHPGQLKSIHINYNNALDN